MDAGAAMSGLVAATAVIAAVWQWIIRPLWVVARKVDDLEHIRHALTPNSGTSVADLVRATQHAAVAAEEAMGRLESSMADHRALTDRRLVALNERVSTTNARIDRALEILAGAPTRAGDRGGARTRRTDGDQ